MAHASNFLLVYITTFNSTVGGWHSFRPSLSVSCSSKSDYICNLTSDFVIHLGPSQRLGLYD